jgi:thiamine-monophosphate kinase
VTGTIGLFATALLYLLDAKRKSDVWPEALVTPMINRLVRPAARVNEGRKLGASGVCTACQDISDGLLQTVREIATLSGCGFVIDVDRIPFGEATYVAANKYSRSPWTFAIGVGADFELVFAVPQTSVDMVQREFAENAVPIREIGQFTSGRSYLQVDAQEVPVPEKRWEHFRGRDEDVILKQLLG